MKNLVNITSSFKRYLAESMPSILPSNHTLAHFALICAVLQSSGCSRFASRRATATKTLQEESKALTTAVVDTLQLQPTPQRDPYTVTALRFAKQDQHIEGLPLQPFDMPALLPTSTNNHTPETTSRAEAQVVRRFAQQDQTLKTQRTTENHLVELGLQTDATQQRRIHFWTKAIAWLTLPVTILIAVLVFFPIALPLFGRLLGLLVNSLPRLAGFLGVVSIRAFDTVVHGLEKWKNQTLPQSGVPTVANPPPSSGPDTSRHPGDPRIDLIQSLHSTLSREMDATHKTLVRTRKP